MISTAAQYNVTSDDKQQRCGVCAIRYVTVTMRVSILSSGGGRAADTWGGAIPSPSAHPAGPWAGPPVGLPPGVSPDGMRETIILPKKLNVPYNWPDQSTSEQIRRLNRKTLCWFSRMNACWIISTAAMKSLSQLDTTEQNNREQTYLDESWESVWLHGAIIFIVHITS